MEKTANNIPSYILLISGIVLLYFLWVGVQVYFTIDVPLFGAIHEIATIPFILFTIGSFLYSLYRVFLNTKNKKAFIIIGLLNLATIAWLATMTLSF
ncbi:MAG: hypothetical protein ACTJGD_00420 [Mesonia hippocampi]|uniref:hypothetical protein n=1 Tax=Mesonia hippocampi TaxID=1628250 RepID=UPI003F95B7D3